MWMPGVSARAPAGARFPGQYSFRLDNEEQVSIFFCEAGQTPGLKRFLIGTYAPQE
jgi:hypothetical protein